MFSTPTSARCTKCGEVKHVFVNPTAPGLETSYIVLHESVNSHSTICLPSPHQKRNEQLSKLYEKLFSYSASPSSYPLITVNNTNYEEAAVNTGIIDQMCAACLEQLLEMANEEIEELQNEKIQYSSRIEKRRSASLTSTAGVPSLLQNTQQKSNENEEREEEAEIEKLQKEELELRMKLVEHQMTLNSLQAKHKVQQAAMKQLNIAEEKYWLYFAKTTAANIAMRENDDTLYNTFVRLSEENQKLTNALVNVEQAMFSIKEHPDKSVQINGFRLAKKRDIQWEEVNTALGLSMLLMIAIAKKKQFAFSTFALIPKGSSSLVQEMESGVNYELFHSGRRKNEGRFNMALKGFLCCLKELQLTVKKSPIPQANPFPIEGDSVIGGVSIIYSPSDEETWSKAMRRVLINLMYLQKN